MPKGKKFDAAQKHFQEKEIKLNRKMREYEASAKEALEKAKELMAKGYDVLMPELFPELKESEDECVEKIRKDIISYLSNRQITSISETFRLVE